MRQKSIYLPHGGGPCFFMDPPPDHPTLWDGTAAYLRGIAGTTGARPAAVLVISAHWECERPTVQTAAAHTLLYDYYGFPEHTYRLTYPAPGAPAVAARVRALLAQAGIESDEDAQRGLDHGVFIPFKLIYPDADIPLLQLSLQQGLDAERHIAIGRALATLRDEGVLIVGSGMSYHNLREFFAARPAADQASAEFDAWLGNAVESAPDERARLLARWDQAPGALASHPRSEHLIPLMVAAGAAGEDAGRVTYRERLLGKTVCGVRFGN